MKYFIVAKIQQMAASEILNIIPPEIYQQIKQRDSNPLFRAYVVGHEGESGGNVIGVGKVIIQWFNKTIRKLVEKLQFGTKLFHEHNQTNDNEGRMPVGELVGKKLQQIKDKLSAIAIAYIYPEYRTVPLDVASIEADVNLSAEEGASAFEADVQEITGIALGNSAVDKPGFKHATLLAELQAFANKSKITMGSKWKLGYKIHSRQERKFKLAEEGE